MAEQKVPKDQRYIAKIKCIQGSNGTFEKILLDNLNAQLDNGEPNTFFKGQLVWCDATTGKNYKVKQMSIGVPRDGMRPAEASRGFTANITIDLNSTYEVEEMP